MAEKKKEKTATQKWAEKKKKPTTSNDMWMAPGQAKKAAQEIEKRKRILNSI